ncbi:hypothetical protein RFI_08149 [Reticulomyxa filosa]|uniref:XK-related protein n=1 Tax=Reticulomyxa filosa TaxID=46433 RepID=X6NSK7_RETFI|nr:hypothetical protein RFI_08149 [Reticulomyxa filosa]|eukprot:ETO28976.1 hypothetical protein RFI_08149 [Reticulomyxa filosa]
MPKHWRNVATYLFDMYNLVVSLADMVTDVLVLQQYYEEKQTVFFWIGAANLALAQLCYSFVFVMRHVDQGGCWKRVLVFLAVLPISPLLCIVFYWESFPNNRLSKLMEKLHLNPIENATTTTTTTTMTTAAAATMTSSAQRQNEDRDVDEMDMSEWARERIQKNLGFILEAIVEAFPQSLLQMTALVYTQRVTWMTLCSIFLSLASFATKSIVFSRSLNVHVFVFNWLSMVIDFVGIFTVVSWVFFVPSSSRYHFMITHTPLGHFTWLAVAWFYKMLVCSLPFIFLTSVITTGFTIREFFFDLTFLTFPFSLSSLFKFSFTLFFSCLVALFFLLAIPLSVYSFSSSLFLLALLGFCIKSINCVTTYVCSIRTGAGNFFFLKKIKKMLFQ